MSVTKAKTDNITSLNAAQLTGVLPAMSGAALTGLVQPTKSANDPTISTNPSTGVGTLWANTTSGEMFACTDATAGENVWINVGSGSGDVQPSLVFQGSIAGYTVGSNAPVATNVIDKYSYTSQANATDVGDLITTGGRQAGHKSETHGYASGGDPAGSNIEKYSFASDGNAVDAGYDLSVAKIFGAGASTLTHGYSAGGASLVGNSTATGDTIDKFSYSGSSNATDVGNLSLQRNRPSGHTSTTHGYIAGGTNDSESTFYNVIDKYSFSSNGDATDVGDLTTTRAPEAAGSSSITHGFCAGGYNGGSSNVIDKFSFSSNGNATDVGDLVTGALRHAVSTSSTTHSYTAGGFSSTNVIQRHAYASSGNTVDWADLTVSRFQGCGSQY